MLLVNQVKEKDSFPSHLILVLKVNILNKHLSHGRIPITKVYVHSKLDQGALGMSDALGPLQLALKPNSASSKPPSFELLLLCSLIIDHGEH